MAKRRRSGPPAAPSPPPGPRPALARPFARLLAALLLLGALAAGAGWWWRHRPPADAAAARSRLLARTPRPADLSVLLVTLDTLRADRLGCYGFRRISTPALDSLAAEGVLFEQATATVPLTLPSHASILTGLVPPHHGVHDNGGYFLEEKQVSVAERFREAGFATGAFVGAWVLDSRWGTDQGFARYDDRFDLSRFKVLALGTVQRPGGEVVDAALEWLETVRERRFFAWVHLYDPHTPYEPPEPHLSRYPGQPYLGEIAYTDEQVGRLLSWLRRTSLLDRTAVVVVADHGESLGEHGEATHTFFVYDATVHVPLLVRTPWGDRGRVRAQVSTVDVFPTLLDLAGLAPQPGVDGTSLARLLLDPSADEGRLAYSETYFPRFHFGWHHLRALRDGRFKYVEAPRPELYDVRADPGETRDVRQAWPQRADEMRQALEGMAGQGELEAPNREEMDPETLQRLAALGYVGSAPPAAPGAVLADPKDKIGLVRRLGQAKEAAKGEDIEEAVGLVRGVLAEDPGIVDAHVSLGGWLRKLDRQEEAVTAYRAALALQPDNEGALAELASVYRALGRNDAAVEGYRTALRLQPRQPQLWYQLATLFLDLDRPAEAEATFRSALEHNPKMGAAYNSLSAIAFQRGELERAEELVRRGLRMEPEVRGGRYNLARILEARGDAGGAEGLYREELRTYADHGRARFNLAQLRRERGDGEGYLSELRECTEKAPEFGPCFLFLAREELRAGRLEAAASLARRGLEADPRSEVAPLGHYVLADVLGRQGRRGEATREAEAGRRLESQRAGRARRL